MKDSTKVLLLDAAGTLALCGSAVYLMDMSIKNAVAMVLFTAGMFWNVVGLQLSRQIREMEEVSAAVSEYIKTMNRGIDE